MSALFFRERSRFEPYFACSDLNAAWMDTNPYRVPRMEPGTLQYLF